jgi:hypothetical protein
MRSDNGAFKEVSRRAVSPAIGRPPASFFMVAEAMKSSRTELEPIATILLPNSAALPGMNQNGVGRLSEIL